MHGLFVADNRGGSFTASTQIRRAATDVMRITSQDMHQAVSQHLFGPSLGASPEPPEKRAGRHLHPYPTLDKRTQQWVFAVDPGQTLWMREYRDVAREKDLEEEVFNARRGDVMRRFDEYVPR